MKVFSVQHAVVTLLQVQVAGVLEPTHKMLPYNNFTLSSPCWSTDLGLRLRLDMKRGFQRFRGMDVITEYRFSGHRPNTQSHIEHHN